MTRIVDFDVVDRGTFWTFEPLTPKARAFLQRMMPGWPIKAGLRLDEPQAGMEIVAGLLAIGLEVDIDGKPASLRRH